MENSMRVLVVDDEESVRSVLVQVLEEEGYEVSEACSGEQGLKMFRAEPFPLVITDVVMTGMSGIQLLNEIKQIRPDTEVIIVTSFASMETTVSAIRGGAYDYLIKNFEDLDLISDVVKRAVEKIRLVEENRNLIEKLKEKNERIRVENEVLEKMNTKDEATGLFNNDFFQDALARELHRSIRCDRCFSIVVIQVNSLDSFVQSRREIPIATLLQPIAKKLQKRLRKTDIVARYGEDKFIILLPETPQEGVICVAESIQKILSDHLHQEQEALPEDGISAVSGWATYPKDAFRQEDLITSAFQRLSKALDAKAPPLV
jgi:diguanylate cyclase (GGDEF)-like protein